MKTTFLAAFAALSLVASTTSACKATCDHKHKCHAAHVVVHSKGGGAACGESGACAHGTAQAPCAVAVTVPAQAATPCPPAADCPPVAAVRAAPPRAPITVRVRTPAAYAVPAPVLAPVRVRTRAPAVRAVVVPCTPSSKCSPTRQGARAHGHPECAPSAPHGGSSSECPAGAGLSSTTVTMPESLLAVAGTPAQAGAISLPTLVMAQSGAGAQAGATPDSPRIRSLLTRVRETPPEPAVDMPPCAGVPAEEEPCPDADDEEDEDDAMVLDLQSALAPLASLNFDVDPDVLVLGDLAAVDGELGEGLAAELAEVGREAGEAAREAYQDAMEAWEGQQGNWKELQEAWREQQGEWREHQEELRKEIEERVREATAHAREFQKEYAAKYQAHARELQEHLRAQGVEAQKRSKDLAEKVRAKLHKKQAEEHAQDADRHAEKADKQLRQRIERMEQQARRRRPGMEQADGERSLEERVEQLERLLAEERASNTPGPSAPRAAPKLERFRGDRAGPSGPSGAGPSGPKGLPGPGPSAPSGAGRPGGMAGIPGAQWKALQELGMLGQNAPFTPHVYTVDPQGKKWKVRTAPKVVAPDGQSWTWWSPDSEESQDAPAAREDLQDEIEKRMEELRAQMGDLRERLQVLRTELGRQPQSDGAR